MPSIPGLEIIAGRPAAPDLVADYLRGAQRAAGMYVGSPDDDEAYARKADEVASRLDAAARRRVTGAIRPTTPEAEKRIERIMNGAGFFVTTGQQTGLFGGPLYTTYKILTAVRLARRLENVLDQPVAPLFWVASDDHDWAEVNHADVVDASNTLRRAVLPDDGAPHPMSIRRLPDQLDEVRESFLDWLPPTEFVEPLAELLRTAYQPGRTVAEAFSDLIAGLFVMFDLSIVDPAHADFKRTAAPVLRRELDEAARHAALLERRTAELLERGYHAQVTIAADAANVLVDADEGRDRLMREDGRWQLRRSKKRLDDDELRELLDLEPERFSPNVLLRPVVESALLPTISYVGGPGELSYFAQIGPLFEAHGIRPPVAYPRATIVLVESKVRKVLDKSGLEPRDFAQPLHELTTRVVRDEMPDAIVGTLDSLRSHVRDDWDRLAGAAQSIDPTLRGWLDGQRNQALSQVDTAEKKVASHLKKKNEIIIQQIEKAAVHLYPNGAPQERVLNLLPYAARYGPDLLPSLAEAIRIEWADDRRAEAPVAQTEA